MDKNLGELQAQPPDIDVIIEELRQLFEVTTDVQLSRASLPSLTAIGRSLDDTDSSLDDNDAALVAVRAALEAMVGTYYEYPATHYFVVVERLNGRASIENVHRTKNDRRSDAAVSLGLNITGEAMTKGDPSREHLIIEAVGQHVLRLANARKPMPEVDLDDGGPGAGSGAVASSSDDGPPSRPGDPSNTNPTPTASQCEGFAEATVIDDDTNRVEETPGVGSVYENDPTAVMESPDEPGAEPSDPPSRWSPSRWRKRAAVLFVAVIAVTGFALLNARSESPTTQEPGSATTEDSADPSGAEADETDEENAETSDTDEADTDGQGLEGPVVGPEIEGSVCLHQIGEAPPGANSDLLSAAAAIVEAFGNQSDQCAEIPVEFTGVLYWQHLTERGRLVGGIAAVPLDDDSFEVVELALGPWQSYRDVANPANPVRPGVPTGRIFETENGWEMEVTGPVRMLGESVDGKFFWTPALAFENWVAAGGATGQYGSLQSKPMAGTATIEQDFANGTLTLATANGLLEFTPTAPSQTFTADDAGTLVSTRDFTGWFIAADLTRWWIPDGQTWTCLGGDDNVLDRDIDGSTIATLTYGGVATCPANVETMGSPNQGSVDLLLYCLDNTDLTNADIVNGRPTCTGPSEIGLPIDHDSICDWQYGHSSTPSVDGGFWKCSNLGQ